MRVLVVNAGSSSLKLRALDHDDRVSGSRDLLAPGGRADFDEVERFLRRWPFDAIGHRVVHGGARFRSPTLVTDEILAGIRELAALAPLHNPPALEGLEAVTRIVPDRPSVACFDTAFHATIPDHAAVYAVPWGWTEEWGIRRYGFHGLNHAYVSRRTAALLDRPTTALRIVTCHLGAGASLAAVAWGRSVDTTMGFTPLEGLVMATRSGSVDPGALLWLQRRAGLPPEEVERALVFESGLLGLSGVASGMSEVLEAADGGDERARLAADVYLHRLRTSIAAMAASMGGVDAIAFTGGVGEGSARVREDACRGLQFLGIAVDPARNAGAGEKDIDLSPPDARVRVLLVHAREDLEIAHQVRQVLEG